MKNFYTIGPWDVKRGDVFAVTLTVHVQHYNNGSAAAFKVYRCPYKGVDVPQGSPVEFDLEALQQLMPGVASGLKIIAEREAHP